VSFHESSDVCVDFGRLMVACELREPNSQLRESIPSAKHSSSGRRLVPVVGIMQSADEPNGICAR
jgi:hypothetical protein